ncbi:unnamed protein product [Ectocarpus sp. 4 AP-2014]
MGIVWVNKTRTYWFGRSCAQHRFCSIDDERQHPPAKCSKYDFFATHTVRALSEIFSNVQRSNRHSETPKMVPSRKDNHALHRRYDVLYLPWCLRSPRQLPMWTRYV